MNISRITSRSITAGVTLSPSLWRPTNNKRVEWCPFKVSVGWPWLMDNHEGEQRHDNGRATPDEAKVVTGFVVVLVSVILGWHYCCFGSCWRCAHAQRDRQFAWSYRLAWSADGVERKRGHDVNISKSNEKARCYVSRVDKWETKEDDTDMSEHDQLCDKRHGCYRWSLCE